MYQYNTTPNIMTSYAPSDIIFGTNPSSPKPMPIKDINYNKNLSKEYIKFITNRIAIIRNKAVTAQQRYDYLRKLNYDKNASEDHYEVGQDVMYNVSSRLTGNKRKLKPNFIGPYEIVRVFNDGINYELCDKTNNNTFNVHHKHIRSFIANKFALLNESPMESIQKYLFSSIVSAHKMQSDIDSGLYLLDMSSCKNNSKLSEISNSLLTMDIELNDQLEILEWQQKYLLPSNSSSN